MRKALTAGRDFKGVLILSTLFGLSLPQPYLYVIALGTILVLLALFGWLLRRVVGHSNLREGGGRGRQPRLGLVDTFSIDRQRQLVIIRRDSVEHLLLIGGNSDLVVETNIMRNATASQRDVSQAIKSAFSPPLSSAPQNDPALNAASTAPSASSPMMQASVTNAPSAPSAIAPVHAANTQALLSRATLGAALESPSPTQIDRATPRSSDLSEIARRFDRLTPTMRTEPVNPPQVPPHAPSLSPSISPTPAKGMMPPVSMAPLEPGAGHSVDERAPETDVPETIIDPLSAPIIPLRDAQAATDGLRRLLGRQNDS